MLGDQEKMSPTIIHVIIAHFSLFFCLSSSKKIRETEREKGRGMTGFVVSCGL
jgi:hypothetical protein